MYVCVMPVRFTYLIIRSKLSFSIYIFNYKAKIVISFGCVGLTVQHGVF